VQWTSREVSRQRWLISQMETAIGMWTHSIAMWQQRGISFFSPLRDKTSVVEEDNASATNEEE
jgi:hypothetical protein